MTRGFLTIATGDERYYRLARNLLHSYRLHCSNPYPFALLADRKNSIASEFDQVIVMDNPTNSYMDKLRLAEFLPYDETIFIDADCLAYGDINDWWELFEKADDFSSFGYANYDLNNAKTWFRYSGMKEFREQISFVPSYNGGVYFMRNTETCSKVFSLAKYCAAHYQDYSFSGFDKPADEPVLALGMAVCNCRPIKGWRSELLFSPNERYLKVDISIPKAEFKCDGTTYNPRLIHWGNYKTTKSLYRFEVEKMEKNGLRREFPLLYRLLYEWKIRRFFLRFYDLTALIGRARRKVRRLMEDREARRQTNP